MSYSQLLLGLAVLSAGLVGAQTPAFKGDLLIQPGNSAGKCLSAASNKNGAAVSIKNCTGAKAQKWRFEGGSLKIYGSKCLDVIDGKNQNGNKFQIWDCSTNKNPNQQFYYTPWGDNHIAWTDRGRCIDLTDGSLASGNKPQLWDCDGANPNQVWNVGYMYNQLPEKSEDGQSGVNNCGTGSSKNSQCQTGWINSAEDFCLWAPPTLGQSIGESERHVVSWCLKSGRGARTIPDGTLKGVHFKKTPDYVQITGVGDLTKMNILKGDDGGELDPHGPDGNGNPVGGLLFGNGFGDNLQYHEWTSFISENEFCIRACTGPRAREYCEHIYDVMGCYWNMPANYDAGTFEECQGDSGEPMGVYGKSKWHQGVKPTPKPHPQPASSKCKTLPTVGVSPLKKRSSGFEKKVARAPFPGATPAPVA